jgi:hypothetical protein
MTVIFASAEACATRPQYSGSAKWLLQCEACPRSWTAYEWLPRESAPSFVEKLLERPALDALGETGPQQATGSAHIPVDADSLNCQYGARGVRASEPIVGRTQSQSETSKHRERFCTSTRGISVFAYMSRDWTHASLVLQGALFGYYQIIEWVNLFPWNDIRRGNGQASLDLIVAAVLSILILVTWFRLRWLMVVAVGLYGLWAWLQIDSWWLPYFQGASPAWKRTYERFFAETIRFLPSDGMHLAPDACHITLQALIVAAFLATSVAALQLFLRPIRVRQRAPSATVRERR